jgi:hypothetical protein
MVRSGVSISEHLLDNDENKRQVSISISVNTNTSTNPNKDKLVVSNEAIKKKIIHKFQMY